MDLVQKDVRALLQSALEVALVVVRANPAVLEGLGAHLEGRVREIERVERERERVSLTPCWWLIAEKEKVEGEELQKWLKLVVAPMELSLFVNGAQEKNFHKVET